MIAWVPKGCTCSQDQYQALCEQHELRTSDTSEAFFEVARLVRIEPREPSIRELQEDVSRATAALAYRVLGDPRECVTIKTRDGAHFELPD